MIKLGVDHFGEYYQGAGNFKISLSEIVISSKRNTIIKLLFKKNKKNLKSLNEEHIDFLSKAVYLAVLWGNAYAFEKLLAIPGYKKVMRTNAFNAFGDSHLHAAVRSKSLEMVKLVLKSNICDINEKNPQGETPLQSSCWLKSKEICKYLLQIKGIEPKIHSRKHSFAEFVLFIKNDELIELMLMRTDISWKFIDRGGNTALHGIMHCENATIMHMFFKKKRKLDINARNFLRETALHIATRKYFAEGIKALLGNSNINVNAKDHENRTPLDIALHNEYEDAINMLIFHPRIVFSKANRDTLSAFGAILRPRYPNRP